jgi:hypothetical protein
MRWTDADESAKSWRRVMPVPQIAAERLAGTALAPAGSALVSGVDRGRQHLLG